MGSSLKKKLKNPAFRMNLKQFLMTVNVTMPDELIQFIMDWKENIRRSPYSNCSYYDNTKTWDSFVDGGTRVSNHWNFFSQGKTHCITKQPVENDVAWYVGIYDEKADTYDIVKTYPVLDRKRSELVSSKMAEAKELCKPSAEFIEAGRRFKRAVKEGIVYASVDGEKVRVLGHSHKGRQPFIVFERDGKMTKTFKFEIL